MYKIFNNIYVHLKPPNLLTTLSNIRIYMYVDHVMPNNFSTICQVIYLCLIFTSSALKSVGLQVGNGNETTQVADVDAVGIWRCEQPLVEKLSRSVGNLTVSLHLSKPQTSVTVSGEERRGGCTIPLLILHCKSSSFQSSHLAMALLHYTCISHHCLFNVRSLLLHCTAMQAQHFHSNKHKYYTCTYSSLGKNPNVFSFAHRDRPSMGCRVRIWTGPLARECILSATMCFSRW